MRCAFGHWFFGVWRAAYRLPNGGWVCDRHAEELEARGLGRRVGW